MTAQIIAVGRELLTGRVLDTNSNYLARRLTALGFTVTAMRIADDALEEIASAVKDALKKSPKVIIVTGGLGPTPDDMTLAGIAQGLGRTLAKKRKALRFIKSRYEYFYSEGMVDSPELNEFRAKMGFLPYGSQMLENHVGTAPGIHVRAETADLFALPGVPSEMKGMFELEVAPRLEKMRGRKMRLEEKIQVRCGDESVISAAISRVASVIPEVFIKPSPSGFSKRGLMNIYLSSYISQDKVEQAKKLLLETLSEKTTKNSS